MNSMKLVQRSCVCRQPIFVINDGSHERKSIIHRSNAMSFEKFTEEINEPLFKQSILRYCCQSLQFLIHVMAGWR